MLNLLAILGALGCTILTLIWSGLAGSDTGWAKIGRWRINVIGGGAAITLTFPIAVEGAEHFGPGIFVLVLIHAWVSLGALALLVDLLLAAEKGADARVRKLADGLGLVGLPVLLWIMRSVTEW